MLTFTEEGAISEHSSLSFLKYVAFTSRHLHMEDNRKIFKINMKSVYSKSITGSLLIP